MSADLKAVDNNAPPIKLQTFEAQLKQKPLIIPVNYIRFMGNKFLVLTPSAGWLAVKQLNDRDPSVDNLSAGVHFVICAKVKRFDVANSVLREKEYYFKLLRSSVANIQAILDNTDGRINYPDLSAGIPEIHDTIKLFVLRDFPNEDVVATNIGYKLVVNTSEGISTASCKWPRDPTYLASQSSHPDNIYGTIQSITFDNCVNDLIKNKPWENWDYGPWAVYN